MISHNHYNKLILGTLRSLDTSKDMLIFLMMEKTNQKLEGGVEHGNHIMEKEATLRWTHKTL